jgi:hypothetical protein
MSKQSECCLNLKRRICYYLTKKDNEKFFQNINKYFQNKGNESNLDALLEQIQNSKMDDLFKNQSEIPDEKNFQEEKPHLNPNMDLPRDASHPEKARSRKRGRQRRNDPSFVPGELNEEEDFREAPTKHIKSGLAPAYTNVFTGTEPVNTMNQGISEDSLQRNLQPFSMGMSRGPSYQESDMGPYRQPPLISQKSSSDFLFSSPKPFLNPPKEDEIPGLYNLDSYNGNNKRDEEKGGELRPLMKNDPQIDEAGLFSPTSFMNNNPQNGFNFGQPFDDNLYRN